MNKKIGLALLAGGVLLITSNETKVQSAAFGYSYHDYAAMTEKATGKKIHSIDQVAKYDQKVATYQIHYTARDGEKEAVAFDESNFQRFAKYPEKEIRQQPAVKKGDLKDRYQVIKKDQVFKEDVNQ